jgi:hypothetical protein
MATDEKSKYVNLHSKIVKTLWEIATTNGYFADRHTVADQVWSVIEHWEPREQGKQSPNQILSKMNRRPLDICNNFKDTEKSTRL